MEKQREDILFGRNPVFELFDTDIDVNAVYILKDSPIRAKAAALAKKKGCPLKEVGAEKLSLLSSGGVHQGIVASVAATNYSEIDDIFALAKIRKLGLREQIKFCFHFVPSWFKRKSG